MKILKVIPFFTPQMGGSAEVAYQLSAHLTQLGHEVTVLTTDYGQETSRFPEGGCEVICIPNLAAGFGFYFSPKIIPWASKNLASFDIVHLYTTRTFQNVVAYHFCRKQHIPYILSPHGTLPIIMQRQLPKKIFDWIIGRKIIAHVSQIHAVSEIELNQFRQLAIPGSKIELIPNGLKFETIQPEPVDIIQTNSPNHSKKILFVGRIHQIKRIDLLIKAFSMLPQPHQHQLIIVGPDEGEMTSLQALSEKLDIQQAVKFPGPCYGQEKLEMYHQADLVVVPSDYEIFGLVPFEAINCGLPVIVSDQSGSGDLLRKADAGFLFNSGDAQDLGRSIMYVLLHPDEAQEKVINGKNFIEEQLNWVKIAGQYESLFRSVI